MPAPSPKPPKVPPKHYPLHSNRSSVRDSGDSFPLNFEDKNINAIDVQEHPDLYFPDGNIILISEENVAFRLYRGQLSRRSEVFADMLEIGELNTGETYDDCPVIFLQDSGADLTSLFSLLWDIGPERPAFTTVSGALRLATKYFFVGVREWCITRLKNTLPHSYTDLCKDYGLHHSYRAGYLPQDVIQLSYDFNLPFLLPLAFYKLSIHAWTLQQPLVSKQWIGMLTPDILTRLLLGRERVQDRWLEFISTNPVLAWGQSPITASCCSSSPQLSCQSGALLPYMTEMFRIGMRSPLEALVSFKAGVQDLLCHQCYGILDDDIQAFSKRLYDDLPVIFEL